ncbi:MAG: oxidoreductase [Bacteroidota bacterium]|nr:oxidoreductase [Bacteroidota bacterium]
MKNIFFLSVLICTNIQAQQIKILSAGTNSSIRGLSVVDDRIVWVSGNNGMVGRSLDSGNTWKWIQVKGFEKTDFRDIEAFDETQAVIMGVDEPAYILRTIDGGENWKIVYENRTKGMFLDAMEFWNIQSGIVIGDPIDGKFFIARTFDGGEIWRSIPKKNYPVADNGEACFAASGTNVRKLGNDAACFVTGGLHSRLFIRDKKIDLPILQGKETTGANSVAIKNKKTFIVVGGDFSTPESSNKNCVITKDGGKNWSYPSIPPHGYRSCVEYLEKNKWITCGLTGVDVSNDNGHTWTSISSESFHVCRKAKKGKSVFLAGGKGNIGKIEKAL